MRMLGIISMISPSSRANSDQRINKGKTTSLINLFSIFSNSSLTLITVSFFNKVDFPIPGSASTYNFFMVFFCFPQSTLTVLVSSFIPLIA